MFLLCNTSLVKLAFLRFVGGNTPEIDLVHDYLASVTDTVVAQGAFVSLSSVGNASPFTNWCS